MYLKATTWFRGLQHKFRRVQGLSTWRSGTVIYGYELILVSSWLLLAHVGGAAAQPISQAQREWLITSEVQRVTNRPGELEIAVSPDGERRIIATNAPRAPHFGADAVFFWDNVSRTFKPSVVPAQMANRRDPTVAWAGSGDFYFATMQTSINVAVSRSIDGGQHFLARSSFHDGRADPATMAGFCAAPCTATDQPHIAADPRPHPPGRDELYLVWRNSPGTRDTAMIECSVDSGANWGHRQPIGTGHFPRVTVGSDGTVYVVAVTSRFRGRVVLQKFRPCSSGLNPIFTTVAQNTPVTVAAFNGVSCPVAGLDRCNSGNVLSSPTVAVDRANPNRIFVVFATQNGTFNQDIVVAASDDGGQTFPPSLQTTAHLTGSSAQRFLPWSCAARDELFTAWYDRRSATAAQNDATEFIVNRLKFRNGRLVRLQDVSASGVSDPQCASGWPLPARNIGDSESCSSQPQEAGQCLPLPTTACPCPTGQSCLGGFCFVPDPAASRCDFSDGCHAGLMCTVGSGIAKYGDYNGIACSDSGAYVVWASGTAPLGLPPAVGLNIFFAKVGTLSIMSAVCERNPALCNINVPIKKGIITLHCDVPGCHVIVPVPAICEKALNCPGCTPGQLCSPEYHLEMGGLSDEWRLGLLGEHGEKVPATISRNGLAAVTVTFQPRHQDLLRNRGAKYFIEFVLNRNGKVGKDYAINLRLKTIMR